VATTTLFDEAEDLLDIRKDNIFKDARRRAGTARSPPARGGRRRYVASPSRLEPQNSGANQPEPKIDAPIVGIGPATMRRTNDRRRAEPTPAASHAVVASSRPRGIRLSRTGMRIKPVPYPLKNVAVHIIQTPRVRPSSPHLARHAPTATTHAVPCVIAKVGRIVPKAPLRGSSGAGDKSGMLWFCPIVNLPGAIHTMSKVTPSPMSTVMVWALLSAEQPTSTNAASTTAVAAPVVRPNVHVAFILMGYFPASQRKCLVMVFVSGIRGFEPFLVDDVVPPGKNRYSYPRHAAGAAPNRG